MKYQIFEIPGFPLLVNPVEYIAKQRDGQGCMKGPLTISVVATIHKHPAQGKSERLPTCGPDVLAVAFRMVDVLMVCGIISDAMQVQNLMTVKEFGPSPSVLITVCGED